ncbi:MAG TPA: autotransporter outer membrane beta-barrel domain-containing protein, partial [Dokdonella sp.]
GSGPDVLGLGIGAAYYKVEAGLSARVNVNDQELSGWTHYDDDAVAPLLTLGWRHAFSDAFRFYVDASGVKKNGGDLSGHIYNGAAGFEWFPWHNVGIGAEYAVTRIRLDRDAHNYTANLNVDLNGPAAYLRMRF